MLEIDLNSGGEVEVGGDKGIHIQTMTGEHGLMSNKETLQDFMTTIESLDEKKLEAINDMGFGSLHKMGCPVLFEEVILLMINNIDPLNQIVVIHGRQYGITIRDFERLMGIKDGGVDIDFCWEVSESLLVDVRRTLGGCRPDDITIESLKSVVTTRQDVDYIFKAAYVMYALSAVLCPIDKRGVDHMMLLPLLKTDMLRELNWATLCYNKLLDGILTMKIRPQMGRLVCLPFIQIFYFDVLGSSLGWVDKEIMPIMFWAIDRANKVVDLIGNIGGFPKLTTEMRGVQKNSSKWGNDVDLRDQHGIHDSMTYDQLKGLSRQLDCVIPQVREMKDKMHIIEPKFGEFVHELQSVRMCLRSSNGETAKSIVNEIMKQCPKLKLGTFDGNERKPDNEGTVVKSNSGHFDGDKVGGGNRLLSGDSSCRVLSAKAPPSQAKQQQKVMLPGNMEKNVPNDQVNATLSDCSVSPVAAPKMKGMGRKEKRKTPLGVAPKQIVRGLFEENKRSGPVGVKTNQHNFKRRTGNKGDESLPRPIFLVPQNREDGDILDFILMERPKPDVFESVVVAVYEGIHVTGRDLQCLRPKELMYNLVINMFATYLNEPDLEDWFFPTYFSGSALSVSDHISAKEWKVHTVKLSVLGRFAGRIGSCRRIFIPMREVGMDEQPAHFYLLVVHVRGRFAEIMDSCPVEGKKAARMRDARTVMQMLDVVFGDDVKKTLNPPMFIANLPFGLKGYGPRQPNSYDCGVFVIRNMQHYGKAWCAKYDSNRHRSSLVLECVRNKKNEVKQLQSTINQALTIWRGGGVNADVGRVQENEVVKKNIPTVILDGSEDSAMKRG